MYSIVHAIEINVVPYVNHSHIRAVAILQNAQLFKIQSPGCDKIERFHAKILRLFTKSSTHYSIYSTASAVYKTTTRNPFWCSTT